VSRRNSHSHAADVDHYGAADLAPFPAATWHYSAVSTWPDHLTPAPMLTTTGEIVPFPDPRPREHYAPELPAELEHELPAILETTFRGRAVHVVGFQRSAKSGAPMVVARESGGYIGTYPLRSCMFPRSHAVARTVIIPATRVGEPAARLELDTADGESGAITLRVSGAILAFATGFRAPQYGASLLEMTDAHLAGMFGGFLAHALESTEPGARDGWTLTDTASDWVDALTLLEPDHDSEI
jgi:hypothetical protein